MPSKSDVNSQRLERFLSRVPDFYNSELNRAFSSTIGAFTRKFTKERLSGGAGITVRRRIRRRKKTGEKAAPRSRKNPGQPFVPVKARAAGFKASLSGLDSIAKKRGEFRTSNPVMLAHELGATIRPKRGRYLTISINKKRLKKDRRFKRGTIVARVRQVRLKPRLGFDKTWRSFLPEAQQRLAKARDRATQRANRLGRRRSA